MILSALACPSPLCRVRGEAVKMKRAGCRHGPGFLLNPICQSRHSFNNLYHGPPSFSFSLPSSHSLAPTITLRVHVID